MEIGVPKETKDQEFRVGLTPNSVQVLSKNHTVFVETKAENSYKLTADEFEEAMTPLTKMIILNSPPTR